MSEPTVLERHPEVAQLCTLQYAARVAVRVLSQGRSSPSRQRVMNAATEMVDAIDEYRNQVRRSQEKTGSVPIPRAWSRHEGAAVADFLTTIANAVRTRTGAYFAD